MELLDTGAHPTANTGLPKVGGISGMALSRVPVRGLSVERKCKFSMRWVRDLHLWRGGRYSPEPIIQTSDQAIARQTLTKRSINDAELSATLFSVLNLMRQLLFTRCSQTLSWSRVRIRSRRSLGSSSGMAEVRRRFRRLATRFDSRLGGSLVGTWWGAYVGEECSRGTSSGGDSPSSPRRLSMHAAWKPVEGC